MPRGDKTGPRGMGPMTGRGLGDCIKYGLPIAAGIAACFGFRRGRGLGFRRQLSSTDELSVLKSQADILENNLNEVKKQIKELEQKEEKEN